MFDPYVQKDPSLASKHKRNHYVSVANKITHNVIHNNVPLSNYKGMLHYLNINHFLRIGVMTPDNISHFPIITLDMWTFLIKSNMDCASKCEYETWYGFNEKQWSEIINAHPSLEIVKDYIKSNQDDKLMRKVVEDSLANQRVYNILNRKD